MRDPVEPLQIGRHVHCGRVRRWILGSLLEQLDPAGQAREWRTQLMGGLARHTSPDAFACGVASHADDVEPDDEQNRRGGNLQYGDDTQTFDEWRVPEVNLPEHRVDDGWIFG